jgi:glutamine synthetase
MFSCAEYIWLDGAEPTKKLRSKTRILKLNSNGKTSLSDFPEWNYDGSSTYQAPGDKSDLVLRPCSFVNDPIRGSGNYLVMCEVFHVDGNPVPSNTRAPLRMMLESSTRDLGVWMGYEQEYTLFQDNRPLGWPKVGYPAPQGPYYCGVGADRVFGRDIIEEHTKLCLDAGILIFGTNAEVMPAQWEFQIGYRSVKDENADPLTCSDHLWLGRWLLHRVAEKHNVVVSFDNKPVKGDWNGAGNHTNFSTEKMRDPKTGWDAIQRLVGVLESRHKKHIENYGHGLNERLTGLHETCDINSFRSGPSDRGASIRIPLVVSKNRCGYIEDRRPGANCDPYVVALLLLEAALMAEGENAGKAAVFAQVR